MRKYRLYLLTVLFVFLFPKTAFAVDLQLTKGVANLLPVAVVAFAGQADAQAPNNVSNVVMNDLRSSGQFKLMPPQNMTQSPHAEDEVDDDYWRGAGVDNVVVGNVKSLGDNRYQVSFALVSVVKGQNPDSQVLATEQFTVSGDELRSLAHHISDIIYQQLTGARGVFSTRVAYVAVQRGAQSNKYMLQVADIDGYNPKSLLASNQPIMSPAWSHDGKQLAYVSFEKTTPRVYIQNIITGARQVMSEFPGINGAPAWSPDDSKLALVLSKDGSPKIYVMDLASKHLRPITQGNFIDTEPNWAPDGNSLLFTSDRGGGPQIYQVSLAGGEPQRLTFNGTYNARASFSSDGQKIVMINRDRGMYNIALQDLSTGNVQMLTQSGYDASPSFAPNGRMVLYESNPGRQGVLGIVSIDGRVKLRLPTPGNDAQDPAWSPFLG